MFFSLSKHLLKQLKFFSLLILFISLFLPIPSQAGNPTQYVTVHDPYTRLQEGKIGGFGSTLQYYQGYNNYTPFFRVFIPPGATTIDLRIVDGGGNVAVARHNQYPEENPNPKNATAPWRYKFTLSELESKDCYVKITNEEVLYVVYDGLQGLSLDRGGWLYVKVGGGRVVSYFQIQWAVYVYKEHIATYNNWWDHYGSNPDGSINWEKDVESVYQYHVKQKLPGDFDQDEDVDTNDYAIFVSNYKKTETNNVANLDGIPPVDTNDFAIFVKNYTGNKSKGV